MAIPAGLAVCPVASVTGAPPAMGTLTTLPPVASRKYTFALSTAMAEGAPALLSMAEGAEHLPSLQPPPSHTLLHLPQLFGSVFTSTHVLPHVVPGQVHLPPEHVGVLPVQVWTPVGSTRRGP